MDVDAAHHIIDKKFVDDWFKVLCADIENNNISWIANLEDVKKQDKSALLIKTYDVADWKYSNPELTPSAVINVLKKHEYTYNIKSGKLKGYTISLELVHESILNTRNIKNYFMHIDYSHPLSHIAGIEVNLYKNENKITIKRLSGIFRRASTHCSIL